jgi:hypothetical protein
LRYLQKAAKASPENIQLQSDLRELLGQLKKWEDEDKVSARIYELEELYRPTTSASLRPRPK